MSSLKRPLAVLAVLASVSVLAGCGDDESSSAVDSGSGNSSSPSEREGTGTECDFPQDPMGASKEVEPPPSEANVSGEVPLTISTSIGDLQATLDADAAPCTVTSFVSLAEQAYFDSTTCHRVTTSPGFGVLQCGDPTGTGTGGPGYSIPDELEETKSYPAGTLAMAKTSAPNSGGSQFFICYTDTQLPPEYTVFGSIDEASNKLVADAAAAGTVDGGPDGTPKTPVEIKTVTVD